MLTLDHLQQSQHHRKSSYQGIQGYIKEIPLLVLFFLAASIISSIFVNAGLFLDEAKDVFQPSTTLTVPEPGLSHQLNQEFVRQQTQENLDAMITNLKSQHDNLLDNQPETVGYEQTIKQDLNKYGLTFNTLPPTNRLIIPAIHIDVPIVDIVQKTQEHIDKGSYEKELYQGVVKYPTTPTPDQPGNVFIFGHSSFYRRKNNPYGTVFKDIPELKKGDLITIQREGKEYRYQMIDRHIVLPKQVNAVYDQYTAGDYLTLMGCYPIGSDEKRLIVIAKKVL